MILLADMVACMKLVLQAIADVAHRSRYSLSIETDLEHALVLDVYVLLESHVKHSLQYGMYSMVIPREDPLKE